MRISLLVFCLLSGYYSFTQTYSSINSKITFKSTAPLEIIVASSSDLNGVLDLSSNSFAFKIYVKSFKGFANPLQQEHFYENYMEVETYPLSIFKGKILEKIQEGKSAYRAKGRLEIHGVEKEVIVDVILDVSSNEVRFYSEFTITLKDYDIDIPRIVEQKIATEIEINAQGKLEIRG